MPINFINQSLFRTLAFSSIFLPVLSFAQPMADATQSTINTDVTTVSSPSSEAKNHLITKLAKLAFFSANFEQKILNSQGDLLLEGTGTLAINKPNLMNWKTITPDETLLVSDGNTLWSYDPFIEQASAYSLANSIHNTPILLLTSDEPSLWQQYNVIEHKGVVKSGSRFVVMPKSDNSQIKKLTLSFSEIKSNEVELTELSFQDATGQISQISLSNFNSKDKPAAALFKFTLPQGVRLEDQR
ncbi:outer membrane lipoprotein chaperone LolA [Colwellia psychrerythraea]|uniref:Outer-membrane lipoprotein carrier protein n=1 Tax=Colwellia psychrerythraea TaxID=28229 RepID=A0A099KPT2_COLPS|nr:outer membrane lipoprotein chaperone LolA [Colwellia psychrerythraea]KGJ92784.1 Outer-membrane lipoprotein carrier protein [Colwellia psychrerythraea]